MVILTDRDREILETLDVLRVMTSSQIQRLFFTTQPGCARRLKQLTNHKIIKVHKEQFQENIYYRKKLLNQQRKSGLLLSEFYVLCKTNNVNIVEFKREYEIPNTKIRADGRMIVRINNIDYEFLIEVNLTHFDGWKYEKLLPNMKFSPIISISPCKRKYSELLETYHIKQDFKNMKDILPLLT